MSPRVWPQMHLPNVLTMSRLVLTPVFVALFVRSSPGDSLRGDAAAVFLVASLTDLVDGYLARRRNQVSTFGTIADPIADKLLTGSALVGLSLEGTVAWWVTGVILGREVAVTAARFAVLRRGVIAASPGGKAKTVSQIVAIVAYLAPVPGAAVVATVSMSLAVPLTVLTGVDYLWRAGRMSRV